MLTRFFMVAPFSPGPSDTAQRDQPAEGRLEFT
jgi:hypothetical protein